MSVSVLTIVRNRSAHLLNLVEGVRRSAFRPDEVVVVDMSDEPLTIADTDLNLRVERVETEGLPLAKARNRAAAAARGERLIFLDVDCIPMRECIGMLAQALETEDALICGDVRYLGPGDADPPWDETALLAKGVAHPVRPFPPVGLAPAPQPGLFWSLAFAIRKSTFEAIGGFDERFSGYGAEDTDFGFAADAAGCPILFMGGAVACHQYHESCDPPLQHLGDIIANARRFHAKWGIWPMDGWLRQFAAMGLIVWQDGAPTVLRQPTEAEMVAARSRWPAA